MNPLGDIASNVDMLNSYMPIMCHGVCFLPAQLTPLGSSPLHVDNYELKKTLIWNLASLKSPRQNWTFAREILKSSLWGYRLITV